MALFPDNFPNGLAHAASLSNEADQDQNEKAQDVTDDNSGSLEVLGSSMQVTEVAMEAGGGEESLSSTINTNKIPLHNMEDTSEPTKIINVTHEESLPMGGPTGDGIGMSKCDDFCERRSSNSSLTSVTSRGSIMSPPEFNGGPGGNSQANFSSKMSTLKGRLSGAFNYWTGREKSPTQEKPSSTATPNPSPSEPGDDVPVSPTTGNSLSEDPLQSLPDTPQIPLQSLPEKFAALMPSDCGLPLEIFTKGNLVHPYLSLQYLDVLSAPTSRAFLVGASNALFVHKKHLYDVLVQLEEGKIEIPDPDLKRQLSLSTEDLRFAENIVRQVEAVSATLNNKSQNGSSPNNSHPDVFLEGVGWVGGEEWLRYQFKVYLLSLLRSSVYPDAARECEVFNGSFMTAWKETHNYRMWKASGPYPSLMDLMPAHPHAGNLSMTDMRIRLSHTIQGLDKGRRINQTLATTGTAVVKTKEAVGGALTSARGAITNLWSSFTTTSNTSLSTESSGLDQAVEAIEAQCNSEQTMQEAQYGEEVTETAGEREGEQESSHPADIEGTA
ncbi:late secretory pathway protein AVL9 homolog isoform X3 [Macrobrachium rosenbergii]|uniref:late secretory pathway protein AVL9 homolog isoform X3 n=1 Tax=Macrobrachium rosenbergii TaxID=79674 RepID=UPI0034D68D37